jgi:uncharacterized membrane protein
MRHAADPVEGQSQGATVSDSPQYQPIPPQPSQSGLSDTAAGALAYVTVIPAIIFLLVEPYNKNSFIRFHSWQSIFLLIACVVIDTVLGMIPIIGWFVLLPLFGLGVLILWIVLLLKALKGERFQLPLIGKLAAQQAGA